MKPNLPIYRLSPNDDETALNWEYTAFVDKPATGELFMAFDEQRDYFEFKTLDEERRIVMGPIMVANLPIYRKDPVTQEEFLVVFYPEDIDLLTQKHFKQKLNDQTNPMHKRALAFDGVFMYQNWIIDKDKGINVPSGFNELPDGSLFGIFKVDNDEVWTDVKAGKYKGFSIEGKFSRKPMVDLSDKEVSDLTNALEGSNL